MINDIWSKVVAIIWPQPEPAVAPQPKQPEQTKRHALKVLRDSPSFTTLKYLLDRLEDCERCMAALYRNNNLRAAVDLPTVRSLGAFIAPAWVSDLKTVHPHFGRSLPSMGLVHLCGVPDIAAERFGIGMVFFRKVDRAEQVEPFGGPIYEIHAAFVLPEKGGDIPFSMSFHVGIEHGGGVHLLRCALTSRIWVNGRKRGPDGLRRFSHPQKHIGFPNRLCDLAAENDKTPQAMAAEIVSVMSAGYDSGSASDYTVRVKRNKFTMRFDVPVGRTAYFFKDRIKVQTTSGRTRPIYHHVQAHYRESPDGSIQHVRAHQRGTNLFQWKGYDVLILKKDHDGFRPSMVNLTTYEEDSESFERDPSQFVDDAVAAVAWNQAQQRRDVDGNVRSGL